MLLVNKLLNLLHVSAVLSPNQLQICNAARWIDTLFFNFPGWRQDSKLSGPQKNKMDKCREFVEVLRRNCFEPHDANLWHLLFEEPDDH